MNYLDQDVLGVVQLDDLASVTRGAVSHSNGEVLVDLHRHQFQGYTATVETSAPVKYSSTADNYLYWRFPVNPAAIIIIKWDQGSNCLQNYYRVVQVVEIHHCPQAVEYDHVNDAHVCYDTQCAPCGQDCPICDGLGYVAKVVL